MTYNLVRGWAPLRGVIAERSKYVDLPIPELYDLGRRSEGDHQSRAGVARSPAGPDEPAADLQRRSAEPAGTRVGGGGGGPEVARLRPGQRPRAGRLHGGGRPQASRRDRSRSAHRHDADAGGARRGGGRDAEQRDRAASRHRGCLHLAGARLLGRRAAGDGHRRAREGARRAARPIATSASVSASISPRAMPTAPARSRSSRACRPRTSRR